MWCGPCACDMLPVTNIACCDGLAIWTSGTILKGRWKTLACSATPTLFLPPSFHQCNSDLTWYSDLVGIISCEDVLQNVLPYLHINLVLQLCMSLNLSVHSGGDLEGRGAGGCWRAFIQACLNSMYFTLFDARYSNGMTTVAIPTSAVWFNIMGQIESRHIFILS